MGKDITTFHSAIDGAEFKQFHETLKTVNFNYLVTSLSSDKDKLLDFYDKIEQMELLGEEHEMGVPFSDPGSVRYLLSSDLRYLYNVRFTEDGKLLISFLEETTYQGKTIGPIDPMELITIENLRKDADLGVKKGEKIVIPAIGLFYYQNKQTKRQIFEAIDVAVILISIATLGAGGAAIEMLLGVCRFSHFCR